MTSAFIVAGTHSGCGKTTVSLGIMAALKNRGMKVQPFKVGPDFIDPGHHAMITGRTSHNLDGWMMDPGYNRSLFNRYAFDADAIVVEGVMGLFDGFSPVDEAGSTAEIAKILSLPVFLVVDARSLARSVAALVLGFKSFDPDLNIAGVILNRVGSRSHIDILEKAIASVPGISVAGSLPRNDNIRIPSRHLGLVTSEDMIMDEGWRKELVDWVEDGIDMDGLLMKSVITPYPVETGTSHRPGRPLSRAGRARIGVARDKAFCFYYMENLRLLQEAGAEIIPFSPLEEKRLPGDLNAIILGGGYPEIYSHLLSRNISMLKEVRDFALGGGIIYAECGGFMYLMKSITDMDGASHEMVGVFPFSCHMEPRFKALGYREISTRVESVLGPPGTVVRGHEFHYSRADMHRGDMVPVYDVRDRKGKTRHGEGFAKGRVLASYIHLHWGSNPDVARNFVDFCTGN